VVRRGVIRTPPPHAGILKGVTRDTVMELAAGAGYDVREEMLNRYDIYTADEAFFTGTAAEVVGIREVDGRAIGTGRPGAIPLDLAARFNALVRD
jgi:branched-chain amino acid aminotransferase